MRKIQLLIAGIVLVVSGLAVTVGNAPPASAACTAAPYLADAGTASGDRRLGTWQKHYDARCDGTTEGDIWITWHSWFNSNNDLMISIDMSVQTYAIEGNDCVYVALDWEGETSWSGHEDAHMMRNCLENSTRNMSQESINIDKYCTNTTPNCHRNNWPIKSLQIGSYDPDSGTVYRQVCLNSTLDPATNTNDSCWGGSDRVGGWNPDAPFGTVGAKIYRTTNAGSDQQNDPTWPNNYDVKNLVDPNK